MAANQDPAPAAATAPPGGQRWVPVAVLLAVMALVYAMGWHEYLSFKTIGVNYESLKASVAGHKLLAALVYALAYVAVVALSLPGALVMTLAGGLLFGWQLGAALTVVAATIGATLLFVAARTSFGETLAAKAGPSLAKLRDGFKENALSYLLFLRLVPAFPFFIVNLAPALLGVPLKTFVLGTFLGIIPGTIAFSVAGSGLGSVVEAQNKVYQDCLARAGSAGDSACPYTIDTSALLTRELLAAFVLLGVIALLPVALKRLRGRHAEK
jgi:uncharacterized membrane protein YdjX (TVP38/TMEM64 family)